MQVNSAYFLCLLKGGLTVSLPLTESVPKEVADKSVKQIAVSRAIQQPQFPGYLNILCMPFMAFLPYMPYPGKMPEDGKTMFPSREEAFFRTPLLNLERNGTLAPGFLGRGIFAGNATEGQAVHYGTTSQANGSMHSTCKFTSSVKPLDWVMVQSDNLGLGVDL